MGSRLPRPTAGGGRFELHWLGETMSSYYYEKDGVSYGPVDAPELNRLHGARQVSNGTLVWAEGFETWRRLDAADVLQPRPGAASGPPPLPPTHPAPPLDVAAARPSPAPAEHQGGEAGVDRAVEFLDSDITKAIVGPHYERYRRKWTRLIEKHDNVPSAVGVIGSWNWAAAFFTYIWAFYRKQWGLGALALGAWIIFLSIGPFNQILSSLLFGILFGALANSLYFKAVYPRFRQYSRMPDPKAARLKAEQEGGVSWLAGIAAAIAGIVAGLVVAAVLGAAGRPGRFASLLPVGVSCSSSDTLGLVQQIARENIDSTPAGASIIDSAQTTVTMEGIITGSNNGRHATCRGTLKHALKFRENAAIGINQTAFKSAIEKEVNQDVTYTVDLTDKGDQIQVKVLGLPRF